MGSGLLPNANNMHTHDRKKLAEKNTSVTFPKRRVARRITRAVEKDNSAIMPNMSPLAVTMAGQTWFSPDVAMHPMRREIEVHEAIHRAQFAAAGQRPTGSLHELEAEARHGTAVLLSNRPYEARYSALPDQCLGYDGGDVAAPLRRDASDLKATVLRGAASHFIARWGTLATDVIRNDLPTDDDALSAFLVHAGTMLWALAPLMGPVGPVAAPIVQALAGVVGAELAILGSTALAGAKPNTDIKTQLEEAVESVQHSLLQMSENGPMVSLMRENEKVYEDPRLAVWYTLFPSIGFENEAQITQMIKAAALNYVFPLSGTKGYSVAVEQKVIAAMAAAVADCQRWIMTVPGVPSPKDQAEHINEYYRWAYRSLTSKVDTKQALYSTLDVMIVSNDGELQWSNWCSKYVPEVTKIDRSKIVVEGLGRPK